MSFLLNPFRLNAGGGGGGADPNFADVIGLWGWEAASPNHLLDESSFGHNLTAGGSFARGTPAKFGTVGAGRTGAGTASRGTLAHDADFIFSGAFTIECWHFIPTSAATTGTSGISKYQDSAGNRSWAMLFTFNSGSDLQGYGARLSTDGTNLAWDFTTGNIYADNVYRHVCLERNSSDLVRLYVDGVVVGSQTVSGALFNNSAVALEVGGYDNGGGSPAGYRIDEVRITRNVARYNGAFTPPTAAFPRS